MARIESDREDLMREATGLNPRGEIQLPQMDTPVVAGFRSDDRCSVYFDAERCYHFDAHGRLRRAFVDGHLYRTQGETLARLARERTDTQTTLLRHDLTSDELAEFITTMRQHLQDLVAHLDGGTAHVLRVIPVTPAFTDRLTHALQKALATDQALAAPFPTRRR